MPRYKDRSDRTFRLDVELNVLTAFRRDRCELWWRYYDEQFAAVASAP